MSIDKMSDNLLAPSNAKQCQHYHTLEVIDSECYYCRLKQNDRLQICAVYCTNHSDLITLPD